jgi:phosphoglycerate dehydrogenase-like enzyme
MEEGGNESSLLEELANTDALIVCHGAPRIEITHLEKAPHLVFIGELEGDRFGQRIDVEAATARGIRIVDTTQGSSYPVAEWALALMLLALRNAASLYRKLIAHEEAHQELTDFGYLRGELTGKRVGLIGCGHIGRRLIEFLRPFQVDLRVCDPYLAPEMADAMGFLQTTLEFVLSRSDVIVCLAPLTPRTRGMLGAKEFALLPPGAAFVNVSRGRIVDSAALIARLREGDVTAALDVFDPEPIPIDSPIRDLPNVFLSPHIAGVTAASRPRFFTLMVDELVRFFQGHATKFDLNARTLANRRGDEPPAQ